jgi:hypothetical protein
MKKRFRNRLLTLSWSPDAKKACPESDMAESGQDTVLS